MEGAVVATLVARLTSDIKGFSAGMAKANRDLQTTDSNMQKMAGRARRTGAAMTKGLTVPVAAGLAGSVVAFSKFDGAMTESLAIMGDLDDSMRKTMDKTAREVAKTTTFSAEQAAESYFFLASAGLDAEQSVAALPRVSKFAQAGMFDMATATDLATDAQSALGLTVKDSKQNLENMTRVTDVFVKANQLANTSVEQISQAVMRAGAQMQSTNMEVEQGTAILAALADQGIKGARAGTQLRNVLNQLPRAVRQNQQEFKDLGIEVFDNNGEMRHFADILDDVNAATGDMSVEARAAALDQLGLRGHLGNTILMLRESGDAIRAYESELQSAGGAVDEVANKQLESFNSQLELIKSSVIDSAISIGETLAPMVLSAARAVGRLAEWFSNLPEPMQRVAAIAALIAAAAGPLIWMAGSLVTQFTALKTAMAASSISGAGLVSFLTNPLTLALAAGIAAVVAYNRHIEGMKEAHDTAAESSSKIVEALQDTEDAAGAVSDATANLRTDLRGMSDEAARAKLFRIGFDLVTNQGLDPEQAFRQLERIAQETFGRKWSLEFDASDLGDIERELEAVATTAGRVGQEIADNWVSKLGITLGTTAQETMTDIAKASSEAFKSGDIATAVERLAAFEQGMVDADVDTRTMADSMNYLTDEFLKNTEVAGLETSSSADLADAMRQLARESSTATVEQKQMANAIAVGIDSGRDMSAITTDLAKAQRLAASTGADLGDVLSLLQRASQGDTSAMARLHAIQQDATESSGELEAAAEGSTGAIEGMEEAADPMAEALGSAFSDVAGEAGELESSIAGAMASSTSLVQAFAGDTEVAMSDIKAHMQDQQENMRGWADNMRELAAAGLDQGLLRELAEAGPESAALVAQLTDMVKTEGVAGINEWRDENKAIVSGLIGDLMGQSGEAEDAGAAVGGALGSGIAQGIAARRYEIERAARNAVHVAREAAEEGGRIMSPSKLFRDKVGIPIAQGVAVGIRAGTREVEAAARHLMTAASSTAIRSVDSFELDPRQFGAGFLGAVNPEQISQMLRSSGGNLGLAAQQAQALHAKMQEVNEAFSASMQRQELVANLAKARQEGEGLAEAIMALQRFDAERARAADERKAALQLEVATNKAQVQFERAGIRQQVQMLSERMAATRKYSDAWMAMWNLRRQKVEELANLERQRDQERMRRIAERRQARLDEMRDLQSQVESAIETSKQAVITASEMLRLREARNTLRRAQMAHQQGTIDDLQLLAAREAFASVQAGVRGEQIDPRDYAVRGNADPTGNTYNIDVSGLTGLENDDSLDYIARVLRNRIRRLEEQEQ